MADNSKETRGKRQETSHEPRTTNHGANGIATAEEFRAAARVRGELAPMVLPCSGLKVLLRRPSPLWFLFHGLLPASLAARLEGGQPQIETADDLRTLADWMVPLLGEVFVEPRLVLEPGPAEISPDLLELEDVSFIIRWAVGEVTAEAGDLARFRNQREPAAGGADGSDVALPAK